METYIYQLKYTDEVEAISDLKAKGVIINKDNWSDITESVVWNIKVPNQKATYDNEGEVLTEATYKEGYHVDIMIYEPIEFTNAQTPITPSHTYKQTL